MEEETEERKRRKKKTAGEEEATVVCVLFVCLLGKKQASWAEHEREATGSKEGARRRMRRLAPSPLRPGPGGTAMYSSSGVRQGGHLAGTSAATSCCRTSSLPGRRKHKNKTWSRKRHRRCVVLFSLGIRGERGSEISHTAYGILGPPAAFQDSLQGRMDGKLDSPSNYSGTTPYSRTSTVPGP